MTTATGHGIAAAKYTAYVSVLPRNSRNGDGLAIDRLASAQGMTTRLLPNSGILYIFAELTVDEALAAVRDLLADDELGVLGATIDAAPARYGAARVTIDPRLIAD